MTMNDAGLYMVSLKLDASRLAHTGRGLPPRQEDDGILAHRLLSALFGEGVVQPFRVNPDESARSSDRRFVAMLGYASKPKSELRDHADTFADPADHAACSWEAFDVKKMPRGWEPGTRLGFEVRICPVVRLSSAIETKDKQGEPVRYSAGSEVDAWVHRRFLRPVEGTKPSREEVFSAWLDSRLSDEARLLRTELRSFRRTRLVRLTHGEKRKARVLERPDAIMSGELEVTDGGAFHERLQRGVGRHSAFGFGMLLLRPPG